MLKRGGANDEMRRRRRVGWMEEDEKKKMAKKKQDEGKHVSISQPCGAIAWLYVCAAQTMRTEGAGGTLDETYQALREPHFCNYHY